MPLIDYMLEGNKNYSWVATKDAPEFIAKMKSIGAINFGVYEMTCGCRAGYRYDENGYDVPCDRCAVGRATYRYENGIEPDPVF